MIDMTNTSFAVYFNNKGVFYKSINTPICKKVLQYVVADGMTKSINSAEWNKEINTEEELREFAEEQERLFQ